jgi:hypothetical protein
MKRPSFTATLTTLATVAAASAVVGIAIYELYTHPRLRRKVQAQTYEAMAMAMKPLQKATRASRKSLGKRFGMMDASLRDAEKQLTRKERRLRDEADAERMAAMVGL